MSTLIIDPQTQTLIINPVQSTPNSGVGRAVQGSTASPLLITNVTTIILSSMADDIVFLQGSVAPITLSYSQLSGGKIAGSKVEFIGRDDTNTVTIAQSANFVMTGDCTLRAGSTITFTFDGVSIFYEDFRNDK